MCGFQHRGRRGRGAGAGGYARRLLRLLSLRKLDRRLLRSITRMSCIKESFKSSSAVLSAFICGDVTSISNKLMDSVEMERRILAVGPLSE